MDRSHRATEGILLLFVSLIILLGAASVFLAKLPELRTQGTANINTASTEEITSVLMIDYSLAKKICRYRDDHGRFPNTASLAGFSSDIMDSSLRVREPGDVTVSFWLYTALMMIGFFILHVILRKGFPSADPYILPCIYLLAGLGAIELFSIKDPLRDTYVFPMQVKGILAGIIVAMVPLSAKFRSLRLWRYTYMYALLAVGLTILQALFGTGPGGAKLALFGFQPGEITKIALTLFVASYLAERWGLLLDKTGPKRALQLPLFRDIGPLVVMYLLSLATFLLVKDMGPMLVLFGMFVAMLYAATGKPAFVGVGVVLVSVTGWLAYTLGLGVFDVRVDMWLHPWNNSHANGMQLGQALWGLGTGGAWGSGLGLGNPDFMARSGSDLIFASIGEELGLVGSAAILVLCGILVVRGIKIALHARTDFDRFLAAGFTLLLGIQTTIIIFGVIGLLPLTGVTLPFVAYGRSSVIASFFIAGLLLTISSNGTRDTSGVRVETHRALRGLATGLVVLIVGVGMGRLLWIQGIRADQVAGNTVTTPDSDGYVRAHINPRLRTIEAAIPRGTIYDRNGKPLATSRPSELSALGRASDERYYPYGSSFSHLVGYLNSRCGGPVGFEKWRNGDLRGFDDYSVLLPIYRLRNFPYHPKLEGKDVRLTIDAELQETVEKALRKYAGSVRDHRTGVRKHKGAAVVLDVYTGEVLAAVAIPNFDPNGLSPGRWMAYNGDKSGESVFFDRALNGVYPPGSTFKLVTAAAALENGLGDFAYNCRHQVEKVRWKSGRKTYSRKRITDLEEMRPHGLTGLAKAIRASCNLYFAHLGIELGADRLYDMAHKFRLSRIALPKKLVEDLPDNAYGQGVIQVTPLEMARVVAAIANGGIMMKPQFVKDVRLGDEVFETVEPAEMGRPLDPATASALRKMMADATSKGTARGVFDGLNVSVAGKTGSAENDQADGMPHSWFVGFAPVDDPRIAFAVVVENGGYGRAVAGPICREIVKAAL